MNLNTSNQTVLVASCEVAFRVRVPALFNCQLYPSLTVHELILRLHLLNDGAPIDLGYGVFLGS
jgi:hypothetical protein